LTSATRGSVVSTAPAATRVTIFELESVTSWNVLLRPVVALRRRSSSGSDLEDLHPLVNLGLRAVITAERYLPVRRLPGVTLLVTARRPG